MGETRPLIADNRQESSDSNYGAIFENQESDDTLSNRSQDENNWRKRTLSRQSSVPTLPATLTWEHLNVFAKLKRPLCRRGSEDEKRKQILFDVTGTVKSGELVCLMGASGAGKTTLINTLTARNVGGLEVEGSIRVNGQEIGRDITAISAYIQQDDLFVGTLTVREHLIFQAILRLPKEMTRKQKIRRADEIIQDLGLTKCANTQIGIEGQKRGISGGEAKRLAFASEILTNPSILFCDEPTTGLDSYMADSVVHVLQKIADKGKTIVCIIHQPASEVYALFNRVLLLAEGRTAFFGAAQGALNFFQRVGFECPKDYNPADFFIQVLAVVPGKEQQCKTKINKICDEYEESEFCKAMTSSMDSGINDSTLHLEDLSGKSPYRVNWFIQFLSLLWRSLLDNFRDPRMAKIKIGQKIVLAIFVGLMYYQTQYNQKGITNFNGALYFILLELTFPALFGVLTFFPNEFGVLVREHHNGLYKVSSYYISKLVSFLPVFTTDGILLVSICYFMIGFNPTAVGFFTLLGISILVEQSSCAFGMLLSAATPSFPVAIVVSGPILTLLQMMGGLYSNVSTIPAYLSWIQWLSWFRFGFEAMAIDQWKGVTNITCESTACTATTGEGVLQSLSFNEAYLTRDCGLMLVMIFGFHIIGYFALWIRCYRAR